MIVKEFLATKSSKFPRVIEFLNLSYFGMMVSYLQRNSDEFWQNYELVLEDISAVSALNTKEIYLALEKFQKAKNEMANERETSHSISFDSVCENLYEMEAYPISEHFYYAHAPHVLKRKAFVQNAIKMMESRVCQCMDVGVGPGVILASVLEEKENWYGYGIDISARCVAYAKKMMEIHELAERTQIERADARAVPHPDETFELVIAMEVLEHLPDALEGLKEVTRILKRGAHAILALPVRLPLLEHLSIFSAPEEVRRAYTNANLSIEQFETWESGGDFIDTFAVCRKS
jgi:2-polyprenyl-3-methyl-5-hydroxy-6-metoxy-1,4-benzoquinol methylase